MRRGYRFLSVAALVLTMSAAREAHADGDAEAAKKHFETGRALRDSGDCARAIPEFEKSVAADKSIGGYYNVGFCQEQLGLRQDAYDAYRRARDMASAKKDERLKEVSGALAALLETPNVRLVLPNPIPAGLQIWVDNELVPASAYLNETVVFTKPMPVHDVRATAPGHDDLAIKLETRELKSLELKPAGVGGPKRLPPIQTGPQKTHLSTQHWIGGGVFAIGAVSAAISSIIFVNYTVQQRQTLNKFNAATATCAAKPGNCAEGSSLDEERKAAGDTYNQREADYSDATIPLVAAFAGGLIAMGGGVVLFLTAKRVPDEPAKEPAIKAALTPVYSPSFQGLSLQGTF